MNLNREIVFSWLEEDNTQRAYFRLKPLLTVSGDVQEEAAKLWPEDGALRIVPDKNEQGYFKDRMRSMGSFCLMDLTPFPPEANKIRTNKNFHPDREERNQFILYSDAVKAVPENTFYEVLEGAPEDAAALAAQAATPLFMVKQGDVLYGPVARQNPATPDHAPEMEAVVYELSCPDGKQRVILCREEAAASAKEQPAKPVPAKAETVKAEPAQAAEAPLPIGKPLSILDENKGFTETLAGLNQPLSNGANLLHQRQEVHHETMPAQQLTGTPLMRSAGVRTSVPRPKNYVQEVVANQMRAARNDPPAAPLPNGVTMRAVDNPVERACAQLQQAWQMPEAQQQLVDFVLSLPGMSARIVPSVASSQGKTPLQQALQHRLDDLEAERLAALIQLDKAKEDMEAFRKNAVETAGGAAAQKLREQEAKLEACKKQQAEVTEQLNALSAQRDAVEAEVERLRQNDYASALTDALNRAQMVMPVAGQPLRLHTRVGEKAVLSELAKAFARSCEAAGVPCTYNAAVAFVTAVAVCKHVGLTCKTMAPVTTLAENLAHAMGWHAGYALQTSTSQTPVADKAGTDGATPMILLTTLTEHAAIPGVCTFTLGEAAKSFVGSTAYAADPYPVITLPDMTFVAEHKQDGAPLSLQGLKTSFTKEEMTGVHGVLAAVLQKVQPLSGKAVNEMERFTLLCAEAMEGGLAAACDWAILWWVLPRTMGNAAQMAALRPLLLEYPLSLAKVTC